VTGGPDHARGVFETLLVRAGRPVELDAHLARLDGSLRTLFGTPLPARARKLVLEHADGAALARLRLDVAPNGSGQLTCAVRVVPVDPALVFPDWPRALRLRSLTIRGGLGAHKWADRRRVEAAEADHEVVPLVVDADGSVLEASRGNLFVVLDGALVTPRDDGRILPGITRGRVLELAADANLDVRERDVSSADLRGATEAFLTGAVRGVEPIASCDDGPAWPQGAVTTLLSAHLRRRWDHELEEVGSR
jgi:para-aminobenzoate synthetase/4-amino-4-deoxychorismate lyase